MQVLDELLQNLTFRHHDKIKKTCAPLLDHFGINHFAYLKIDVEGKFVIFSSYPQWIEYYFSNHLFLQQPHFCHPRNFCSGISIANQIESSEYTSIAQLASEKFNVHFGLGMINKHPNAVELISFDLNSSHKLKVNCMLNELILLQKFVPYFFAENPTLKTAFEESSVNLKELMGKKFESTNVEVMARINNRHEFLKKIDIDTSITLSTREEQILNWLTVGCAASKIATHIHLSRRTVEAYIVNLKNKLNCHSKQQLVQKSRELASLGIIHGHDAKAKFCL